MSLIVAIRIRGMTGIKKEPKESLDRLRLRRKFACILARDNPENAHLIKNLANFVAFGKIDKETLIELIKKRGQIVGDKKIDAEKIAVELLESKIEKRLDDFGLKPFFRLHPPRGGIETKHHFPKGILGDNKEKINELVRRML